MGTEDISTYSLDIQEAPTPAEARVRGIQELALHLASQAALAHPMTLVPADVRHALHNATMLFDIIQAFGEKERKKTKGKKKK